MSRRMPALVNHAPGAVELREVDMPEPAAGQALVRVRAVGVCGSDLHQWEGTHSWHVNHPVTLGHEFAGEVATPVPGFAAGDRVVSETAAVVNPRSPFTRTGAYNLDPDRLGFGYGVDGAMTHLVAVPARLLHHVPDALTYDEAALTEPSCVAYQAVIVNGELRGGESVLVLGPGPIGLLCVTMAAIGGSHPLAVVGAASDGARLEVARELGATATAVVGDEDLAESLRAHTDGYGYDLVVDAAGVSASLATALEAVRPGGRIVKVGWGPQPLGFSLDPLVAKAVTLRGSFSHTWTTWERVLELMGARKLDVRPLIGKVAPLEGWLEAFRAMRDGEVVKSVLRPGGR